MQDAGLQRGYQRMVQVRVHFGLCTLPEQILLTSLSDLFIYYVIISKDNIKVVSVKHLQE